HLVQAVKGMKELFLGGLFASDELNIVYQKNINRAILGTELLGGAVANGVDNFIGELFGRDVEDSQAGLDALVSNSVQEMGFTEPHATIEEEWVIGLAGSLGHRQRGGVCQAIAVTNDKGIEGIARIEAVMH